MFATDVSQVRLTDSTCLLIISCLPHIGRNVRGFPLPTNSERAHDRVRAEHVAKSVCVNTQHTTKRGASSLRCGARRGRKHASM